MVDLKDFPVVDEDRRRLARLLITAGTDAPFCYAELRSLFKGFARFGDVTERTYGVRTLSLAGDAARYGTSNGSSEPAHLPDLLRAYMHPKGGTPPAVPADRLVFWAPSGDIRARLEASDAYQDAIVAPLQEWPLGRDQGLGMPVLRLAEGTLAVRIDLDRSSAFRAFLAINRAAGTLLGDIKIPVIDNQFWDVTVSPEGIEFQGSIPDPTRGFNSGEDDARLTGRFRLACDPERGKHPYVLRLMGPVLEDRGLALPDDSKAALSAATARFSQAFSTLLEDRAPLAIRFDEDRDAPPLIWPLKFDATEKELSFAERGGAGDPVVEIDFRAMDFRMRTQSPLIESASALASIYVRRATWHREADDAFELNGFAGNAAKVSRSDIDTAFAITFVKEDGWAAGFGGSLKDLPVNLALRQSLQTLTEVYAAGGTLPDRNALAPYAFVPLREGWLQLPIPGKPEAAPDESRAEAPAPGAQNAATDGPTRLQAMSGQIVASATENVTGAVRGFSIDDAEALVVSVAWSKTGGQVRSDQVSLTPTGPNGQALGFLFVQESSPTSDEALPSWLRGPAASRALPLWFGSIAPPAPAVSAAFTWENGEAWSLSFASADENPDTYAWLRPGPHPFVTNYPLTRADPSAPTPSQSRGLVPRRLGDPFKLSFDPNASPENELPELRRSDDGTAAGVSFGFDTARTRDPGRLNPEHREDSLILPPLVGPSLALHTDPDIAGNWRYEAAAHFDVPLLDELFAWSDPPPPDGQSPKTAAPKDAAERTDNPIVTALLPNALAEAWAGYRRKMRLTWTQGAVASPWFDVNAEKEVEISSLVEPFKWPTNIKLTLNQDTLLGAFRLGSDDDLTRAAAAVGLGGDLGPGTSPARFDISANALEPAQGGPIEVTGFAASLFERDADHGVWDSRGFAISRKPERIRPIAEQSDADNAPTKRALLSMEAFEKVAPASGNASRFPLDMGFWARDLAVSKSDGKWMFHGIDQDDAKRHAIEGSRSLDGQAFEPEGFAEGLGEWRFFDARAYEAGGQTAANAEGPQPFEIAWGPFSFRPLRLESAVFDEDAQPLELNIIGGMTLAQSPPDPSAPDVGFGPDDIYTRSDLFRITLSRDDATEAWQADWTGCRLDPDAAAGSVIVLKDRPNTVTVRQVFTAKPIKKGFCSTEDLDVELDLNIGLGSATVRAWLWGAATLAETSDITFADDILTLKVTSEDAAQHPAQAWVFEPSVTLALSLNPDAASATHELGGALMVLGAPERTASPDPAAAIVRADQTSLRWLDLEIKGAELEDAIWRVDHATGVVTARNNPQKLAAPDAAFLDLTAATPLISYSLSAVVAAPAQDQDGLAALSSRPIDILHGLLIFRDTTSQDVEKMLRHDILLSPEQDSAARDAASAVTMRWQKSYESPIRWPVSGLSSDGTALTDLEVGPLEVQSGDHRHLLTIGKDAERLTHHAELHLRDHVIPMSALVRRNGKICVRGTHRMLAAVHHELGDGRSQMNWWSLDHIALTTPKLMQAENARHSFVPRNENQRYRGDRLGAQHALGVDNFGSGNAAGFFDPGLQAHFWQAFADADQDRPVLVAATVAMMPVDIDGKLRAFSAVLPWVSSAPTGGTLQDPQEDATWRVALADLWAAHALNDQQNAPRLTLFSTSAEADLETRVERSGLLAPAIDGDGAARRIAREQARLIPFEQAFFEAWRDGEASQIDAGDHHTGAPYFLRAMLAVAAWWPKVAISGKETPARIETLIPHARQAKAAKSDIGTEPLAPASVRVELREGNPVTTLAAADSDLKTVSADLIVLSKRRASHAPAYRQVRLNRSLDPVDEIEPLEMRDNALLVDRQALFALRLVETPDGLFDIRTHRVDRGDDPLAVLPAVLTAPEADIVASPALGWPEPALGRAEPAGMGPEHAVQSAAAGFSARAQQTGWPAIAWPATPEDGGVAAHYIATAHHVAYDRGNAPMQFDGPAARHLLANPPRRRAPLHGKTVQALAETSDASARHAPLSPPLVERTTIGRRPGVFEAVVTSATSVTYRGEGLHSETEVPPFTEQDYGRPAEGGPALAHQVRFPRSPVLPRDSEVAEFGLRRRTFLSHADRTGDTALLTDRDPTGGDYDPFKAFDGVHDVLRLRYPRKPDEENEPDEWRIAFTALASEGGDPISLRPGWNGTLFLRAEGRRARAESARNLPADASPHAILGLDGTFEPTHLIAQLRIGDRVFTGTPKGDPIAPTTPEPIYPLSFEDTLTISDALSRATADTQLQLTIEFPFAAESGPDGALLPLQKRALVSLPITLHPGTRRVVDVFTQTVAFGDPSYDRQLASQTASAQTPPKQDVYRLAADRTEYNPDSTVHFAFGTLERKSGLFDTGDTAEEEITFERLAPQEPGAASPEPEALALRTQAGLKIRRGAAHAVSLGDLILANDPTGQPPESRPAALRPGDRLIVTAAAPGFEDPLVLRLRIVALPLIAPPPSVFSVIETHNTQTARVVLHAASALPTRVEYPDLITDLALGHVRRAALFVWRYARPAGGAAANSYTLDLIKIDRSGGAQLPPD